MKLSRDGWAGLAVLAASLVLFALTLDLKKGDLVPIGPGFYPRIVLGVAAALSALLVAFDFFRKDKSAKKEGRPDYAAVALQFVLFGLYVGVMPGIGFRLATFAYVAAANAFMAPPARASGWLRVALLALGTVGVTYVVFDLYLTVLLPRGRWTGW